MIVLELELRSDELHRAGRIEEHMLSRSRIEIPPVASLFAIDLGADDDEFFGPVEYARQIFCRVSEVLDNLKRADNIIACTVIVERLSELVSRKDIESSSIEINISQQAAKETIATTEVQHPCCG